METRSLYLLLTCTSSPDFEECFSGFQASSGSIDKGHRNPFIRNKENKGHRNPFTRNTENKGHRNPFIRNTENKRQRNPSCYDRE